MSDPSTFAEDAIRKRYAAAAVQSERALCCPVDYEPRYLEAIPKEVVERDYGCGNPSRYLKDGETVLDLGSGTGKICFIAAQIVGPEGRVIGVDMTDEMLDVARRNAPIVAERIGYANVEFRKGRIQDLGLDLERLESILREHPVSTAGGYLDLEQRIEDLRTKYPLISEGSIDVVVSNCVMNLVEPASKHRLFDELFRVLEIGGRAVISDIVSDEPVPDHLQMNPELWSGCIGGAFTESDFLNAFEMAGFYGIEILNLDSEPWRTIDGIEFRSMTVQASKGKQGPCVERNQAVIYKGPFKEVLDDDGHRIKRGLRYAVCDKTYNLYNHEPYRESFEFIDPLEPVPLEDAKTYNCQADRMRHPRETKGQDYDATTEAGTCCEGPGGDCG